MPSREISVSSNPVSYREREASQIPGNSNFVRKRFMETFKGNPALVFAIIPYQCVIVFVSPFV